MLLLLCLLSFNLYPSDYSAVNKLKQKHADVLALIRTIPYMTIEYQSEVFQGPIFQQNWSMGWGMMECPNNIFTWLRDWKEDTSPKAQLLHEQLTKSFKILCDISIKIKDAQRWHGQKPPHRRPKKVAHLLYKKWRQFYLKR